MPRKIWLDCDPGHDDAIALLLAIYLKEEVELVGISTVNGNAPLTYTHANAAQLLALYRADKEGGLRLHRGLAKPLKKDYIHPPVSIHGHSGIDGVLHLPPLDHPTVQHWYTQTNTSPSNTTTSTTTTNDDDHQDDNDDGTAVAGIIEYLQSLPQGEKITVVITGPCTNIAAVRLSDPELYDTKIDEVVIMGGSLGIPQWTPFAEFNIAVDPDALDELTKSSQVRCVLVPLNVTHKAIFGREVHARLLDPSVTKLGPDQELPRPVSLLRESLSTMLTFFRDAYAKQFEFKAGPPLHDALTIIYLTHPHLISGPTGRLHVDISKTERDGETTFTPGKVGDGEDQGDARNRAKVLMDLDVEGFFEVMLDVVSKADEVVARVEM